MFSKIIEALLKGKLPGMPQIIAAPSLRLDIDELVADVLPPMKLAVVDDARTSRALGDKVFAALKGRFAAVHITLEGIPKADDETAKHLRMQTLSSDALVAVGSGTINDLCKYVSHQDKKPYLVFPTAASMNGYSSANASITIDGYKKTKPAHMPRAIYCDMGAITAAPARFTKAGFGDSIARPTAQADWLLSHLLTGTGYDETPFALVKDIEPELFADARGIALGDSVTVGLLTQILLLSGFGMTIAGGSYPASGGEHMVAHAYEMANDSAALHGETIAITALTMAQMQKELLRKKPKLRTDNFPEEQIIHIYGAKAAQEAKKAYRQKQELMEKASLQKWDEVAEKIEAIHITSQALQDMLKAAKVPATLKEIGWEDSAYKTAMETARFLRERFGFLDLV